MDPGVGLIAWLALVSVTGLLLSPVAAIGWGVVRGWRTRHQVASYTGWAPIPPDVRRAVLDRDGWACVYCGSKEELQIDHIVPRSKGGADTVENYETLCGPCNREKGAS